MTSSNTIAVETFKRNVLDKLKNKTYWTDNLSDEYGGSYYDNFEVVRLQDAINIIQSTSVIK